MVTGCSDLFDRSLPEPPEVQVFVGDRQVPTVRGSYCWRERTGGVCADTMSAAGLFGFHHISATSVTAGQSILITAEKSPRRLELRRLLEEGTPWERPELTDDSRTPLTPGVYTYEVTAEWEQGQAWYAFLIEVP